jgi:hypothetical protein
MLVYANHLQFEGVCAQEAVFKAVGAWLKEQLGYGLHPDQLRRTGDYQGSKGSLPSWLRVHATCEEEPTLYAWTLKHEGDVPGRQWITELVLRIEGVKIEVSCVLRTEELSTLIAASVVATRPRVIKYLVNNIRQSPDSIFHPSTVGTAVKRLGCEPDEHRALLAEIERIGRTHPLVLVSPNAEKVYSIAPERLQEDLVGLAQIVQISPECDTYKLESILGRRNSAWGGAINIITPSARNGSIYTRLFLPDIVEAWSEDQQAGISTILAWVTNNTNLRHLRETIRPEWVAQLSLRRRVARHRMQGSETTLAGLQKEIADMMELLAYQDESVKKLEEENRSIGAELAARNIRIDAGEQEEKELRYRIEQLKNSKAKIQSAQMDIVDVALLLEVACRSDNPTPIECLKIIDLLYSENCIILDSARESAKGSGSFREGRVLLDLLRKLVTDYRERLMTGGDSQAKNVFGKNEYAAMESETVMNSKGNRKARTFSYDGKDVEMFRHLKIGIVDSVYETIRIHFHWDGKTEKIIIGYCGRHLPL